MLTAALEERLLRGELELIELTPEAGPRRYFRPKEGGARGWLLVRSADPPPRATTDWLRGLGVPVPRLGEDREGAYLVEDFGDEHLCDGATLVRYRKLQEMSERFAGALLPGGHPNRRLALDEKLFRRELALFRSAYLEGWLGLPAGAGSAPLCDALAARAAAGPWRLQHRDYHSRNVLIGGPEGLVILDHQDLRRGPCFYDLASLRTDAYVDLPPEVRAFLAGELDRIGASVGLSSDEASEQYLCTALQRVLKALGTFGRMLRERRHAYLAAERRARRHAGALLAKLPAFRELGDGWA